MKSPPASDDLLFALEWTIARRADELTRERGFDPQQALARWREAEREVWTRYAVNLPPSNKSALRAEQKHTVAVAR